jgi:hypothetical protein
MRTLAGSTGAAAAGTLPAADEEMTSSVAILGIAVACSAACVAPEQNPDAIANSALNVDRTVAAADAITLVARKIVRE